MRRTILSLTLLALLVAGASRLDAGGVDLRIGGFFPRGRDCGIPSNQRAEYTLFQDDCELYFVQPSDFDGVYGGIEFNQVLTDYVELGVHYDYYSRTTDTSYRDYTSDGRLRHPPVTSGCGWRLSGLTVRLLPTSKKHEGRALRGWRRRRPVLPVRGVRGLRRLPASGRRGLRLRHRPDHFVSESTAFGYHALGGLRFYLNRDFAIVGEGRYQWGKDDMGEDFAPNEPGLVNTIDLSGWTFTVGVHVRF